LFDNRRAVGYEQYAASAAEITTEAGKRMKQKILFAALAVGAIGTLAGCAKTSSVEGSPSPSVNAPAGDNSRWTARVQGVTQSRGDVAQSTRDRSYGDFTWTQGASPSLSNVNLVFTYAGQERFLNWAIVAGSCGSPALPIIPMSNFPELNVGSSGRSQVQGSIPVVLPTTGVYHVDIYRSRQASVDALVACGNLKYVP
jgi:hypothetical protein